MTAISPDGCWLLVLPAPRNAPNGASFIEVAVSRYPLAAKRKLKRPLSHVVSQKQMLRVGSGRAAEYRLPDRVTHERLTR